MNPYEEKQEQRRERFEALAEKSQNESTSRWDASHRAVEHIPMGQPILVGHHSESRHRNDLKRSWNNAGKAVEAMKKAEYYEQKAAGVGKAGISSDDPEAVVKLKEKLQKLEDQRDREKLANKQYKKGGWEAIDCISEKSMAYAKQTLQLCPYHKKPFPFGSNLSANIRNVKQRIECLEQSAIMPEAAPVEHVGFIISEDKEENRIKIEFPGKPSAEIRQVLKSNGFRWSPRMVAWVRHLNSAGQWAAEQVTKEIQ